MRRVLIVLALLAAAVGALLWLGAGLLGPILLTRYGQLPGGGTITAGGISGPLWSPTARDLKVQIAGVQVSAASAHIYLTQVNPFAKTARVNVALSDGVVDVHFKQLFAGLKGQKKNGASQAAAFKLLPGLVDVRNMRLNLDGQGANIPNAHLSVASELGVASEPGKLNLIGSSDYGPLSANVRYGEVGGKTHLTINALSDARIINEYWHVGTGQQRQGGVLGGQLAAQYRVGNGPLEGDLKVMNATVAVPQARFVRIERINGRGVHRGNLITGRLRGVGLGGPVRADVKVDTKAKNWDVQAHALPTFAALGKALNVPGSGDADLKVHAGGWTSVNVSAQLESNKGSFVSIPYTRLGATYGWQSSSRNRHTTINRNVLSVQADTHLLGEQQRLWGDWHFNKAGKLHWAGQLAHKPLSVLDSIDPHNQMSLRGIGLGGPLQATYNIRRKRLSAQLAPNVYGLSGKLAASGPLTDLSLSVPLLRGAGLQLGGAGRLNKAGLSVTLQQPSTQGQVSVRTDRHWRGMWAVKGLKVPATASAATTSAGATLTGQGAIDLTRRLSGQLAASVRLPGGVLARVPGQSAGSGPLALSGPLQLSGPLSLDWKSRLGQWQAGGQRLSWQGQKLSVALSGLKLSGLPLGPLAQQTLNIGGLATYRLDTRAVGGQLSAVGTGTWLHLTGLGSRVQALGTVRGLDGQMLSLSAQSRLSSPYDTVFSVAKGASSPLLSGTVRVQRGGALALEASTYGAAAPRHAAALIKGRSLNASGAVNLSALYPLLPAGTQKVLAGLRGVALLNLQGQGGTVRVQAQAARGAVQGTLTRNAAQAEQWQADLQGSLPLPVGGSSSEHIQAHLRGAVYPQLDLSGPVQATPSAGAKGLTAQLGPQTLQARLYGPYRALRVQASGQTAPVTLSGVQFPAQALSVVGSLTPGLALSGRWGQLDVQYQGQQVQVRGPQTLTVAGRPAQVTLAATWQPGFVGHLTAVGHMAALGSGGEYQVRASGPWQKLSVALEGAGLRAQGTLNAQQQSYAATVAGRVSGLNVTGALSGVGARPHGAFTLRDAQGGQLQASLESLTQFKITTQGLQVAGQTLRGNLSADGGLVSGVASLGPLRLQARQGNFTAQGVYQRHRIVAAGFWTLPQDFRRLSVSVSGPYLRAQAAGSGAQLRGTVTVLPQRWNQGTASLSLPMQVLPLSASLTQRTVTVGGLSYGAVGGGAGGWNGAAGLRYFTRVGAAAQPGRVTLTGKAGRLDARLAGLVAGQVQVLPRLHGDVSAPLRPFVPLLTPGLPAALRPEVAQGLGGGRVQVRFDRQGAAFATQQATWGGRGLGVTGQVNWPGGGKAVRANVVRISALLTQGATRVPMQLVGRGLTVTGAQVDAQTLQPILSAYPSLKLGGTLRGAVSLDAATPDLSLAKATAALRVNLSAGTQSASGTLSLKAQQWAGNLASTLGGANVSVRGALYPQADAVIRYSAAGSTPNLTATDLTTTLRGDARRSGPEQYQALVSGRYQGRPVQGKATLSPEQLSARLDVQGAALSVVAMSPNQGTPLNRWRLRGTLFAPQTQALLGRSGQLSAQFAGTMQDIQGEVTGVLALTSQASSADADPFTRFTAPLRYKSGVLSAVGATLSSPLAGTRVTASKLSGPLWPALGVRGQVTAGALLPGVYSVQAAGTLSRPVIDASGILSADLRGFAVRGTKLQARLSGKDLRVAASGASLSGFVRGRTDQSGYIQRAELQLNTAYHSAGTALNLRGPLSWAASEGWGGLLNVAGQYQGKALTAQVRGHGDLALEASYAQGTLGEGAPHLSAALPASILQRPGGRVQLHAWDIGALWQRPGQLQLTGAGVLSGKSWAAWQAGIQGQLLDATGELSGPVTAHYSADATTGDVQLTGQKVLLSAALRDGAATLDMHSRGVELARLLPAAWGVGRLNVVGHLAGQGTLRAGLQSLEASSLYVSGQQRQIGDFHVGGAASYVPGKRAQANLDGALLGGTFKVTGSLPAGLDVQAAHLDLSRLSGAPSGTQAGTASDPPAAAGQATSTPAPMPLDARLHLQGDLQNPALTGTAQLTRPDSLTQLVAYGRVRDPRLHARTQLVGKASGTLYADLQGLDLVRRTARVHVYGTATQAQNRLKVDMQGVWPNLAGTASAAVPSLNAPLQLTGQGNGHYDAVVGTSAVHFTLSAASGLVPQLTGQGTLNLPELIGAQGQGDVRVSVSGPVTQPQVLGQGMLRGVSRSGLTLADTALTLSGTPAGFVVQGQQTSGQSTQEVAHFDGQRLTLSGLQVQTLGSDVTLSGEGQLGSSANKAGPTFKGQLSAAGSVQGNLSLNYAAPGLSAIGQLSASGFKGAVNVQAAKLSGWQGRVNVTGGPVVGGIGPVLTQPLNLRVGGDWARPWVRGSLGLLGSRGRVNASQAGVALTFMDGPRAQASGGLNLTRKAGVYVWDGKAHFERAQGKVDLSVQGEAAKPQVLLSAQRGEWRARGQLSSTGAAPGTGLNAGLDFGDGQEWGKLTWQRGAAGQVLDIRSPALNLARLNIAGVSGRVQPYAHLQGSALSGNAALYLAQVKTGLSVPYLEFPLEGSGKVNFVSQAGQWQLGAGLQLSSGPVDLQLRQEAASSGAGSAGAIAATLKANLQRSGGALVADLNLARHQLKGNVTARRLNVQLASDKQAALDGVLALSGQSFTLSAKATSDMGSATLSGDGGIANAAPAMRRLLGIMPTSDGYQVQAQVAELDVAKLGRSMDMSGKVGAQLTLGEGGGTFAVRAPALKLGESTLNTRIDGTRSGSDWRLRGVLGDTTFFGAVTDGQLHARAELTALPLGSVVAAVSGKRVGQAIVTGVARVDAPLADPLAGAATVVAERVKVTADDQTLLGQGSLHFSARELTDIQLHMDGAGSWDVHGHYTRRGVALSADFTNTTFTPLLALIPALSQATLQGGLNMKLGGVYGSPTASVVSQSLVGSYAGSRFSASNLQGSLDTAGTFQAGLQVDATGSVGGKGSVQASGKVVGGKLAGTLVHYAGTLSADSLGNLGSADINLEQSAATSTTAGSGDSVWNVNAAVQQGGTLRVTGQVAPTPELSLTARNYNLPIRAIYARESNINADLKATSDAGQVLVGGRVDVNRMLLGRLSALAKTGNPLLDAAQPTSPEKAASSYNSPLPEALTTFASSVQATQKQTPPFLKRVVFQDIPIHALNSLRVDESLAQAELSADLRLGGTGDNPVLSGEAHSMRGSLTLRDNTFTVQKATAIFDGASLYPTFTLTAAGDVMDGTTRLGVQLQADGNFVLQPQKAGRTLALNTALTCTTCTATTYTEAELYSLLALGTKDVNNVLDAGNLTALGTSAASTALNVFVLGELQRNIAHALGVDVFRINSNIIDAEGNLDASFTVGTHLSKQFYVQYQVDLTGKGLFDATYTTDNGRFTFKASTAMTGFNLETIKPSFSVLYNLGTRHSLSLGIESGTTSKVSAGYVYRW